MIKQLESIERCEWMNYIKEAENYLYHYRDLKISLTNMKKQRDKLIQNNGPKDISSVGLDITGVSGGNRQDEAINVLYQIQSLTKSMKDTEDKLIEVDEVLDKLEKLDATLLKMWYIGREDKKEIASMLNCTERHLYRMKDAAIRRFAIHVLGINALTAM